MTIEPEVNGRDIPLEQLAPLHKRDINLSKNKGFRRIVASIRAVGLIEPLAVYQIGENSYLILDGYLRHLALQELGERSAPCIVYKDYQAYSFNKYVNPLSGSQEIRVLRKSLETLDESKIAETFGIQSLSYRLAPGLAQSLHPEVVKAFEKDLIGKTCARVLTRVLPERQLEILNEMTAVSNYGPGFCRTLVIQTPMEKMNNKLRQRRPWSVDETRKKAMVSRLQDAEKKYDFYSNLYRQYSADLLRVTFYVRKILANPKIGEYLQGRHQEILTQFRRIVSDSPVGDNE